MANTDRRDFLRGLITAVGAASSAGAFCLTRNSFASADIQALGDIPQALGVDRLYSAAEAIVDQFARAQSGQLMAHYQTFWPFVLNQTGLSALERASNAKLRAPEYALTSHRVRALPAVASIHALGTLTQERAITANETVLSIHRSALDGERHREVLEIIWTNVIAAIIRSRNNWENISLERPLLMQGVEICRRFLSGEQILFHPAVNAFHALLTYQKALAHRGNTDAFRFVDTLLGEVFEAESRSRHRWFETLASIMKDRTTFDDMLPTTSEIMMSHESFSTAIADYALLVKLHVGYQIFLSAEGTLVSAYENRTRAKEAAEITRTWLGDYAISPTHWARLRRKALQHFEPKAVKYLDGIFAGYDELVQPLVRTRGEGTSARRLSALVPFRQYDEEAIARAAYVPEGHNSLVERAFMYGPGLFGLMKTSELGIRYAAGITNQELHFDALYDKVEKEIPANVLRETLSHYEEARDHLKSLNRTTVGWLASPSLRGAASSHPVIQETKMDERREEHRNHQALVAKGLADRTMRFEFSDGDEERTDEQMQTAERQTLEELGIAFEDLWKKTGSND